MMASRRLLLWAFPALLLVGGCAVFVTIQVKAHELRQRRRKLQAYQKVMQFVGPTIDWDSMEQNYLSAVAEDEQRRRLLSRREQHAAYISNAMDKATNTASQNKNVEEQEARAWEAAVTEADEMIRGTGMRQRRKGPLTKIKDLMEEVSNKAEAQSKQAGSTDDAAGVDDDGPATDDTFQDDGNRQSGDGLPIPVYTPAAATNCNDADNPIPCPPDNLQEICSKYLGGGSFEACWTACLPSFCCIHDAPPATNFIAPSCNTEENCASYSYCYIAWWKLHDTIGPATQLQLEQNDDFYDVAADFVTGDVTNVQFFQEVLFHHFDDATEIITAGTENGEFNSDRIFLDSSFWDAKSAISGNDPP